jgi:hypothetical protein
LLQGYPIKEEKGGIMKSGKVLIGIIAGIATGTVLGAIIVHKKHSQASATEKTPQKRENFAGALKEKFNEFVDSLSGKVKKTKEGVIDFAEHECPEWVKSEKDMKAAAG